MSLCLNCKILLQPLTSLFFKATWFFFFFLVGGRSEMLSWRFKQMDSEENNFDTSSTDLTFFFFLFVSNFYFGGNQHVHMWFLRAGGRKKKWKWFQVNNYVLGCMCVCRRGFFSLVSLCLIRSTNNWNKVCLNFQDEELSLLTLLAYITYEL